MKRPSILLLILVGLFTGQCDNHEARYRYPEDKNVSDKKGNPKDSTVVFFPKTLDKDSVVDIDPYKWYSSNLRLAKEPIMYNTYLGYDSYRFTWLRSFDEPVVITVNKKSDEYWMTLKKLSKPFVQYQEVVKFVPPANVSEEEKNARQEEQDLMMDTLRLLPKIVTDKRIEIKKENWDNFLQKIMDCNYWDLQPWDPKRPGLDGSNWIIEAHLSDRYWVVERWSPKDNFRDCGQYLIRLSGLDEDIY
jgi:hypothetical protein